MPAHHCVEPDFCAGQSQRIPLGTGELQVPAAHPVVLEMAGLKPGLNAVDKLPFNHATAYVKVSHYLAEGGCTQVEVAF